MEAKHRVSTQPNTHLASVVEASIKEIVIDVPEEAGVALGSFEGDIEPDRGPGGCKQEGRCDHLNLLDKPRWGLKCVVAPGENSWDHSDSNGAHLVCPRP